MLKYLLFLSFSLTLSLMSTAQTDVLKIEPIETEMYGSSCGFVGQDPALRTTIEYLIKEGDVKTIDTWLFSDNPTRKTYAVEALVRLYEQGLDLSEKEIEGIRQTKKLDTIITSCTGCMMGKVTVKEALRQYSL